ncbi:MAG: hypothetical protein JZD41_09460 [Thermoproteus sp.]|nr:hypothetical protein [Thermoproteus sp.]
MAAAYLALAYIVWLQSYYAFQREAQAVASLTAGYVASQVADLMSSSFTPGVLQMSYKLFLPTQFPDFDAYSYSIALINNSTREGAVSLYVVVNITAYRGTFTATLAKISAFAYYYNASFTGVRVYATNYDKAIGGSPCVVPSPAVKGAPAVNLTRPGCGVLWIAPTPNNYKLLTTMRASS